jgi:ABC-type transport system involved in cytochrome c biogenesis permease subunit
MPDMTHTQLAALFFLQVGVILLVMMAIGTTLMAGPMFGWVYRREERPAKGPLALEELS